LAVLGVVGSTLCLLRARSFVVADGSGPVGRTSYGRRGNHFPLRHSQTGRETFTSSGFSVRGPLSLALSAVKFGSVYALLQAEDVPLDVFPRKRFPVFNMSPSSCTSGHTCHKTWTPSIPLSSLVPGSRQHIARCSIAHHYSRALTSFGFAQDKP